MIALLAKIGGPRLIAGAIALGLIGWGVHTVYSSIYNRGHARGVADTQQSERDCIVGSVCAEAVITRAAAQQVVVDKAKAKAKAEAEDAAQKALVQEQEARAAAEERATAAQVAATAAERRYQRALASDQACAVWASSPVPCPLSSE